MRFGVIPAMVSALVLSFPTLAATGNPEPGPDAAAIAALLENLESANNAGDVDRWVRAFADDAVYMAPGIPEVTSREELTEVARAGFRNETSIDIDPIEIRVCDDWAFARTRVTGTVTLHDSGRTIPVDVKEIVIFVRNDDGAWRVARLINNRNRE